MQRAFGMTTRFDALVGRLADRRSKNVVFLSHCILNENTRYAGGACRRGCVREIVELKKRMLHLYGSNDARPALQRLKTAAVPLALFYTRLAYRKLARQVAAQVEDYVVSGFSVLGVVGIDGSPSCGVQKTLDLRRSAHELSRTDALTTSTEQQNALVRRCVVAGQGIFIVELQEELKRRGITVPFLAHDLIDELDGQRSKVRLPIAAHPTVPVSM